MPDLAMCPSTVCSVRKDCMRNWDSRSYAADRDPKIQRWVPDSILSGVGYSEHARAEDCTWYKPVFHFPKSSLADSMDPNWSSM